MTTEAKIHANRLNAQKSTGPTTPQGKAVVSQNALKHGLAARHDVITSESQADFDLHRDALLAELDTVGPMESILADRIVSLSWRLKRADLIQNQTIDTMYEKNASDPLANLAKSFGLRGLTSPQPETSDPQADLTLGRIAVKDFSNARVLDRLLMYERRIEHSLYKTTLELQRLRLLRTLEHPIPHSQHNLAPGFTGGSFQKSPDNQASAAPPFSRRRHDDALTPNSTPRTGPKPSNINHPASSIEYQESSIIAQNKPNPQNHKTTATIVTAKNYERKPPQPHAKKQTQSNPIPASRDTIRDIQYDMTRQQARSASAGVFTKQQPLSVSLPHRGAGVFTKQQAPSVSAGVFSDNSAMDTLTKSSYNAP